MMGEIFLDHPQVFNVLHYVDYGRQIQSSCLAAAALYGGEHLHAIQLEMIWPSPAMIAEFLQEYPGIEVILQVNAQALKDVGNDPAGLVQRLRRYQRLVSVILLDKDMGREEGVDAEGLVPFTRAVASSGLGFNLAVVSGLNPGAHRFIEPLMREFPSMSLEAFCDLKPNRDPAQPTSWNEADVYMIKALRMLQRIHRT
ncbi:MAG: hypothetical protein NTY11_01485 [Candidatus Parcubacteria bacterium]|nr:hypothetical protein [Candidatus Parcubacteria bacterium]